MHDGGQRTDSVCHVVGAVREGQQCGRENQRQGKECLQRLGAVLKPFSLTGDERRGNDVSDGPNCRANQKRCAEVDLDDPLQAFDRQICTKSSGHDPDQDRHPAFGSGDLVFLINNLVFDQGQEHGGNDAPQNRRDHPTCSDLAHGGPADGGKSRGCDARAHDAAHNRVCGRYRRANPRGKVYPHRRRNQRSHHRPDKCARVLKA